MNPQGSVSAGCPVRLVVQPHDDQSYRTPGAHATLRIHQWTARAAYVHRRLIRRGVPIEGGSCLSAQHQLDIETSRIERGSAAGLADIASKHSATVHRRRAPHGSAPRTADTFFVTAP